MELALERYTDQAKDWPTDGRHILAQFDDETVVMYQAHSPAVARAAAASGSIPIEANCGMNFVTTGFLGLMFRSGWGTAADQEATLALRVRRAFFDSLIAAAVPVYWDGVWPCIFEEWEQRASRSLVWSQWEPDRDPFGAELGRWALRLSLRGRVSEMFGSRALVEVADLSEFVAELRGKRALDGVTSLVTPRERVYRPADPNVAVRLGLAVARAEPGATPDPAAR